MPDFTPLDHLHAHAWGVSLFDDPRPLRGQAFAWGKALLVPGALAVGIALGVAVAVWGISI